VHLVGYSNVCFPSVMSLLSLENLSKRHSNSQTRVDANYTAGLYNTQNVWYVPLRNFC